MLENKVKSCSRCQNNFECRAADINNCHCSKVNLTTQAKEFLLKTNYDCLCNSCLNEINNLVTISNKYSFPISPNQLIEGIHYYKENNFWVFTELYHIIRGSCCKNNCRHCAYGFKNTEN